MKDDVLCNNKGFEQFIKKRKDSGDYRVRGIKDSGDYNTNSYSNSSSKTCIKEIEGKSTSKNGRMNRTEGDTRTNKATKAT